ncbi:MAG: protease complex subunit PrcB family protein [Deltaproteobacteria bacterium]|nr:protease complex subunit PrcB family protein [Deltaproteobacteria bacterium]MBI4373245.1 protease complex subunit PrcB family protein [Deltaproteobacteria bacterium]
MENRSIKFALILIAVGTAAGCLGETKWLEPENRSYVYVVVEGEESPEPPKCQNETKKQGCGNNCSSCQKTCGEEKKSGNCGRDVKDLVFHQVTYPDGKKFDLECSGIDEAGGVLIDNEEDFLAMWKTAVEGEEIIISAMDGETNQTASLSLPNPEHPAPERPDEPLPPESGVSWINFDEEDVIGVFSGTKSHAAYGILIKRVVDEGNRVVVYVDETSAGEGCGVSMVVTSPCHFIRLPKIWKPVELFRRQIKAPKCYDCDQWSDEDPNLPDTWVETDEYFGEKY